MPITLLVILQVSASSGRRGVYLREPYEVKKSKHNVSITPVFHKDAGGAVWVGLCGCGSEVCGNTGCGNASGVLGNGDKGVAMSTVSVVLPRADQQPSFLYLCPAAPAMKLSLDLQLALVSSQSWVTAPRHLSLQNGSECTVLSMFLVLFAHCTLQITHVIKALGTVGHS